MAVPVHTLIQILRFKGVFDFEELYRVCHQWLESRGFEFHETRYEHKVWYKSMPPELEIDWIAWRRTTEYFKHWIKMHFHLWDVVEIEAVKNGKKKKLIRARLLVRIMPVLEFDYTDRFINSRFQKQINHFLTEYLFKRKIEAKWEDKLRFNTYELADVIKQTLDMQIKSNEAEDMWLKTMESNIGPKGFWK